ncbi:hypothetical protein VNO77_15104 [Canavalia gladiata]|uniref:Uncharacterized protein n=1 Tax=Canavalia gladiata TaxID=3824 RepID=A0AAN9LZ88_CANGL
MAVAPNTSEKTTLWTRINEMQAAPSCKDKQSTCTLCQSRHGKHESWAWRHLRLGVRPRHPTYVEFFNVEWVSMQRELIAKARGTSQYIYWLQ